MEAPAPIKTLATVGNAGDVIINAFLTVFVAFSQLWPAASPLPASVPFLFPLDTHYEMPPCAKQKRGENSAKLGCYGNVETEQRMGGKGVFLFEIGQCESEWQHRERETRNNYNTSETNLQFFMVQPFTQTKSLSVQLSFRISQCPQTASTELYNPSAEWSQSEKE